MIRVVSTFCVGLLGFACIANYNVSEETRVAKQELVRTQKQLRTETQTIGVLEAEWQKVANPVVIQRLAETSLGMQNAPSVQLASVRDLPRRGDVIQAAQSDLETAPPQVFKAAVRRGM